jgi:Na+/H+-dicarboxylate symporter
LVHGSLQVLLLLLQVLLLEMTAVGLLQGWLLVLLLVLRVIGLLLARLHLLSPVDPHTWAREAQRTSTTVQIDTCCHK